MDAEYPKYYKVVYRAGKILDSNSAVYWVVYGPREIAAKLYNGSFHIEERITEHARITEHELNLWEFSGQVKRISIQEAVLL